VRSPPNLPASMNRVTLCNPLISPPIAAFDSTRRARHRTPRIFEWESDAPNRRASREIFSLAPRISAFDPRSARENADATFANARRWNGRLLPFARKKFQLRDSLRRSNFGDCVGFYLEEMEDRDRRNRHCLAPRFRIIQRRIKNSMLHCAGEIAFRGWRAMVRARACRSRGSLPLSRHCRTRSPRQSVSARGAADASFPKHVAREREREGGEGGGISWAREHRLCQTVRHEFVLRNVCICEEVTGERSRSR